MSPGYPLGSMRFRLGMVRAWCVFKSTARRRCLCTFVGPTKRHFSGNAVADPLISSGRRRVRFEMATRCSHYGHNCCVWQGQDSNSRLLARVSCEITSSPSHNVSFFSVSSEVGQASLDPGELPLPPPRPADSWVLHMGRGVK